MSAEDYSYLAFEKQQEASIKAAYDIAASAMNIARSYEQGGFPDDSDMLKLLRGLDQIYPSRQIEYIADELEAEIQFNERTQQDVIESYQCDNAKMARYEDE